VISKGWIGVDLDGTLAVYEGWQGIEHIGRPVPAMVQRVKDWLADGIEVRIVTARVGGKGPEREQARSYVRAWLIEHVGQALEITNEKDFGMVELWDDRSVQVIPNTGMTVEEYYLRTLDKFNNMSEAA
jgi:hypothetical protein